MIVFECFTTTVSQLLGMVQDDLPQILSLYVLQNSTKYRWMVEREF